MEELERTAQEAGALRRRRGVPNASALLRLCLAYGLCDLSLRQAAAWAQLADVATISDVALLKRLRTADRWLGQLLGIKLAERAAPLPSPGMRIRLVDATTVSRPGSTGTDWRIHLGYNLDRLAIDAIELTDASGGETLSRFAFSPGEVVIADRGYAHRRGLHSVIAAKAEFLVRINWQNMPLQTPAGVPLDVLQFLRALPETRAQDQAVLIAPVAPARLPVLPARLVAIRKSEAAAEATRQTVLRNNSKKGHTMDPRSLESAAYVMVLTSIPAERMSATSILELYRFRWQVELVFKRLKSLLHLGKVPARDAPLARSFLFAKLLAALLLEDFTDRFLAFSPWGYPLGYPATFIVADSTRPA